MIQHLIFFTKYYTIKEYSFFQTTILTNVEYYVSHSVYNSANPPQDIKIQMEIIKINTNDDETGEAQLISINTYIICW